MNNSMAAANKVNMGIGKCGLIEFLPEGYVSAPFCPRGGTSSGGGLELGRAPITSLDKCMHLGILMTPGLTTL